MNPIIPPTKILDSLLLMHISHKGPSHGYALAIALEERFGWKPSQTAIYNSLKAMESEGLVSSDERIESGRVQKIYSITRKGKKQVEETHQLMKRHMMKDFKRFFSFMQLVGELEISEESKEFQERMHDFLDNMRDISFLALYLMRRAPDETEKAIERFTQSLNKIAESKNIEIPEDFFLENTKEEGES